MGLTSKETLEKIAKMKMMTQKTVRHGRVFNESRNGPSTDGEAWLSFGKVINPSLLRDGKEHGFCPFVTQCIDNLDKRLLRGSDTNSEWDAKSNVLNKFNASIIKMRDKMEPGQVKYMFLDDGYALQIRVRDFEAEANRFDMDKLTEESEFFGDDVWE